MKHCPDRIITFVTKLTLKLLGRDALLCICEHLDCNEPVVERQLGTVHYSVRSQALSVLALFTLVTFLVSFPIMVFTAAVWTYDSDLVAVFLPLALATLLIAVLLHIICPFHSLSLLTGTKIILICTNVWHIR